MAFDTVRIGHSGKIQTFRLLANEEGIWTTILEGKTMPIDEYVAHFPTVTARLVRFEIADTPGEISVASFELFPPE